MEIYRHKRYTTSAYILVFWWMRPTGDYFLALALLYSHIAETSVFSGNFFPQFFFDLELNLFGFSEIINKKYLSHFKALR